MFVFNFVCMLYAVRICWCPLKTGLSIPVAFHNRGCNRAPTEWHYYRKYVTLGVMKLVQQIHRSLDVNTWSHSRRLGVMVLQAAGRESGVRIGKQMHERVFYHNTSVLGILERHGQQCRKQSFPHTPVHQTDRYYCCYCCDSSSPWLLSSSRLFVISRFSHSRFFV